MSSKRKYTSTSADARLTARRSKTLFLPMPRARANKLILSYRTALEAVRHGHANASLIRRLYTALLITRFVTDAGHGLLHAALLDEGENALAETYQRGNKSGEWSCPEIDLVAEIINEHDRQLRETRLHILIDASNRLERVLERLAASADPLAQRQDARCGTSD